MSLLATLGAASGPVEQPPGGVTYPQVLREGDGIATRPLLGIALGLLGWAISVTVVSELILGVAYALRGRPDGSFSAYYKAAVAFQYPEGLAASHLALATLIPLSMLLVRYLHRRPVAYLCSVQPGMRWRYLLLAAGVAVVVLNAVMWLSMIGTAVVWNAQSHLWVWLLLIVLTSPLQAAGEEFFFRGYLMQALGSMVGRPWFGVVTSALVFAIFHGMQNVPLFLDRFGFGLLAGVLVLRTGGLEAGIAAHVVNNLFAFGYAALMGGVASARGTTTLTWSGAGWDLLGFALYALAAWWLGRRLNLATTTPAAEVRGSGRVAGGVMGSAGGVTASTRTVRRRSRR